MGKWGKGDNHGEARAFALAPAKKRNSLPSGRDKEMGHCDEYLLQNKLDQYGVSVFNGRTHNDNKMEVFIILDTFNLQKYYLTIADLE